MKKTTEVVVDDYTGLPITDGEAVQITMSVNGRTRVLDLSSQSAEEFYGAVEPWLSRGSTVTKNRRPRRKPDGNSRHEVRRWALDSGYTVAPRGRLSSDIINAYDAAHN